MCNARRHADALEAGARHDKRIRRPHLAAIRVPTLVLVGDRDVLTPPDRSEEMAATIPDARLVVVPGSGHASTLEQPETVTQALVEWLEN